MHPTFLVSLLSAVLIFLFVLLLRNARQVRDLEWHELVLRMRPADRSGIVELASRRLTASTGQPPIEPNAMFEMLGGASGLRAIYRNSKVILALAGYATRWNPEEGARVTDAIRRDALRLQRTVRIIQLEMMLKHRLFVPLRMRSASVRLEQAALLYQEMSQRLLGLYQNSHAGLYPQLNVVLRIC